MSGGSGRGRKWTNEAHLSAKCTQAGQDPRFPEADVDQGRAGGDPVAPGEGTPSAVGVSTGAAPVGRTVAGVRPVRSRRTFEELRHRGAKGRCGPLQVSFLKQPTWSGLEVAYAVNRRVGSAVVRNRLKRRLRAIVSERASSLPAGTYVVHAGPAGPSLEFNDLKVAMNQALDKATRGPAHASRAMAAPDHGAAG